MVGLVTSLDKGVGQFVPMMLGIPTLFCGVVALNPHRRKHAMHASASIAALGVVIGLLRVIYFGVQWSDGDRGEHMAFKMSVGMAALCVVFVLICVSSFVQARRRNGNGGTTAKKAASGAV